MEYLVVGLGLCVVVWVFANSRGRSGFGWFCLSLLISPLVAGLLVLVLPDKSPRSLPMSRRRIEPYLTIAAVGVAVAMGHPAAAAAPDWYVAAPRFHACDAVSSHFTGLHTPEQVQDVYRRTGTSLDIERISPTTVLLVDRLNDQRRMLFFADRGACEAEIAAGNHLYDRTNIPLNGYKSY